MPVMILKALDCERTHSGSVDDLVITISADEKPPEKVKTKGNHRKRVILNKHVKFSKKVDVDLTAGMVKLEDTHTLVAKGLPHIGKKGNSGFHRGLIYYKNPHISLGFEYSLWYEVIPDGTSEQEFHRSAFGPNISLKGNFTRRGRGALTELERNSILKMNHDSSEATDSSEAASLREVIAIHRRQDGKKGNTNSVRQWIYNHCNVWGEESVIPIVNLPEGPHPFTLPNVPNYKTVIDESSYVLGGFVVDAEMSSEDLGATHTTRDFTFNVLPSPQFNYLLAYTTFKKDAKNMDFPATPVPVIHVEWESGSMPKEWRPQAGDYVTVWGRLIFDLGHMPMKTEIHPPHSIVREFPMDGEDFNRAIIGMGFSGGFPAESRDELKGRWDREFDGYIPDLVKANRKCWPTNLKKHTLRKKLFPPVARPDRDAVLKERVNDYKLIFIRRSRINDFLKECKGGAGATDEVNKNFKDWFPDSMEEKPSPLGKPGLISRGDYFDLIVDLGNPQDIPVAYYAEIDIGWNL